MINFCANLVPVAQLLYANVNRVPLKKGRNKKHTQRCNSWYGENDYDATSTKCVLSVTTDLGTEILFDNFRFKACRASVRLFFVYFEKWI